MSWYVASNSDRSWRYNGCAWPVCRRHGNLYTASFHLIDPNVRLIYAFDMYVGGKLFSVSLAGVEFEETSSATELTYTEQAFFLDDKYGTQSRIQGTNGLLDQFASYLETLRSGSRD